MKTTKIRMSTVKLISSLLNTLETANVLTYPERKEIISELTSIVKTGDKIPHEPNRLLTMEETADRLAVSLSTFKRLEKSGEIRIPRRKLGNSVRYQLWHVQEFINSDDIDAV